MHSTKQDNPSTAAAMTVLIAPRDLLVTVIYSYFMVNLLVAYEVILCLWFLHLWIFFLLYIQSLKLTVCQNNIWCKRACYFSNTQPPMDSKMGDREKRFDTKSFRKPAKIFFENEDMNGKAFCLSQV